MDMDSGSKMYYIYTFLLLVITDMPGKYVARDCNIKSMQQYTQLGSIGISQIFSIFALFYKSPEENLEMEDKRGFKKF